MTDSVTVTEFLMHSFIDDCSVVMQGIVYRQLCIEQLHPIQKAPAGNTVESAFQAGLSKCCYYEPILDG